MSEGTMKGSGIDSDVVSHAVECPECGIEWEQDFNTYDWGNIQEQLTCSGCSHEFTYEYERPDDDDPWDNADDAYDRMMDK